MYVFFLKFACPNITGSCTPASQKTGYTLGTTGAFKNIPSADAWQPTGWVGSGNYDLGFDASRSSSIYGGSSTVQPKSLNLSFLIKY